MIYAIMASFVLHGIFFWMLRKQKKELHNKTFLYWEQEGDFKVLKNSKGDIITKI